MKVYWFEQSEQDVPFGDDWLSYAELARLGTLRFAKRRNDWRLGRWTAKQAVAQQLGYPITPHALTEIEVKSKDSGAPEVLISGKPGAVTISLSHRSGIAACAVSQGGFSLGCDLETAETRSSSFVADYFTAEEQTFVAALPFDQQVIAVASIWSAKESALKVLEVGLRADTRSVVVRLAATDFAHSMERWRPLQVKVPTEAPYPGWWRYEDGLVRTFVAECPVSPLITVHTPSVNIFCR
jgi:4'-phosphopantetheinyl transferase